MATVKAVLFDFGGVFTASPFTAFEDMGSELGAKPGQVNEIMFGSYAIDGDHPWHQLERGEISLEQARNDIMAIGQRDFGIPLDIYQLFAWSKSQLEEFDRRKALEKYQSEPDGPSQPQQQEH